MPKYWSQPLIPDYAMRVAYDANGRQEYVGYAHPRALTSEARWSIYRMKYDANGRMTVRSYANSNSELDKVWNNRGNYTYTDI